VGAVEPSETVQVKSQIAGELMAVRFVEGSDVNKNDLLFEIDPRSYREALRQAEAALARDTALMRQAEANLARDMAQAKFASADAARYEDLAKAGVVSRAQSRPVQNECGRTAGIHSRRSGGHRKRACGDR
jgi:multidrug efflux system membrane fusion protein